MNVTRFLLILGNIGLLVSSFLLFFSDSANTNNLQSICFIAFIVLALLNINFIQGIYSGSTVLSIKRKELEEEIKLQQVKNRLKALQKEEKEEV